jgi:hypothetical protein
MLARHNPRMTRHAPDSAFGVPGKRIGLLSR